MAEEGLDLISFDAGYPATGSETVGTHGMELGKDQLEDIKMFVYPSEKLNIWYFILKVPVVSMYPSYSTAGQFYGTQGMELGKD